MNNKTKFISLNVIITVLSIYFTYAVFIEYKQSLNNKVNAYINQSIQSNKKILINTFKKIRTQIEADKLLFKEIHTYYTLKLRKNPKLDIRELRKEIYQKYNLKNKDIHLFLLNKNYTVIDATYPSDIGFKLYSIIDARIELDKTHNGEIYQSKSVSIDLINSEIKNYSYSKINNELFFEMGFINKKISKILNTTILKIQTITNKKSNLYRVETRLNGDEYYDNILEKRIDLNKEEYISSKKMFPKNETTANPIINANRNDINITKDLKDALIIYIPLVKKSNLYLELMGDFILELYIDRRYEIELDQKINFYFYLFLTFHIFFLLVIYYFTKKYYDSLIELDKKYKENDQLLNQNKSFLISIKEQIKVPLSVIMNNFAFIEKHVSTYNTTFTTHIHAAINMLNTSFEDLTYITENEKISYQKNTINLSKFVFNRINFFNTIAISKNKIIKHTIKDEIFVTMNEVELERLIDNNISNAIKYGKESNKINIILSMSKNTPTLAFYSSSEKIKDTNKIFIRNFREQFDSTKSLGLGLSMVKSICLKNNIRYDVKYDKNKNIFIYYF